MQVRALKLSSYQRRAKASDRTGDDEFRATQIAVLGLAGEAGTLATTVKKRLRDSDAYKLYKDHVAEELGDILWYVATIATRFGLDLDAIAAANLQKTKARWQKVDGSTIAAAPVRDAEFPRTQRLPRRFTILFAEARDRRGVLRVNIYRDGKQIGNRLGDNAHVEDGYRFHDVFHLAYAAVLGWSPVTRKMLGRKRRDNENVDEIEDGGRASVIEEGIAAFVFQYASEHNLLEGVDTLDFDILKSVRSLASGLEVRDSSWGDWERAILEGYKMFRILRRARGGYVIVDLERGCLQYRKAKLRKR